MNVFDKENWISDLESGKYRHGKKRLKTIYQGGEVEHCCLGVLCETLGKKILPMVLDHGDQHNGLSMREFNRIEVDGEPVGYEFFEKTLGLRTEEIAILYSINDGSETYGFEKQIKWIRENVVPK